MSNSVSINAILLVIVLSLLFFLLSPGVIVTAPLLVDPNEDKSFGLIFSDASKATSATAAVVHTGVFALCLVLLLVLYVYLNKSNRNPSGNFLSVQAVWLISFVSLLFFLLTPGVVVTAPLLVDEEPSNSFGLIYNENDSYKATSLSAVIVHTVVFALAVVGSLALYYNYSSKNVLSSMSSSFSSVDTGFLY